MKYIARLTQSTEYTTPEDCFDDLIATLKDAEEQGFELIEIKRNKYTLLNQAGTYAIIELIKKEEE